MRVVIPMAGEGRRFTEAGYGPKPFIDVAGQPMIRRVIDSLVAGDVTLLARDAGEGKPVGATVVTVGETQGAVDTLLRCPWLADPGQVLVANCDQWISPRSAAGFLDSVWGDASLIVFDSTNPHHSYVTTSNGKVTRIAEKQVISDHAVAGVYWFRDGATLERYCRRVVTSGDRFNGEFYLSSVIAAMVDDGLTVSAHHVPWESVAMLGTPDELEVFLAKVADGRIVL